MMCYFYFRERGPFNVYNSLLTICLSLLEEETRNFYPSFKQWLIDKYPPSGIPSDVMYERMIIDDKEVQYSACTFASSSATSENDSFEGNDGSSAVGETSDDTGGNDLLSASGYLPF